MQNCGGYQAFTVLSLRPTLSGTPHLFTSQLKFIIGLQELHIPTWTQSKLQKRESPWITRRKTPFMTHFLHKKPVSLSPSLPPPQILQQGHLTAASYHLHDRIPPPMFSSYGKVVSTGNSLSTIKFRTFPCQITPRKT